LTKNEPRSEIKNSLSKEQARALALQSLGIHTPVATIQEALKTLHLFQIDSVNVFTRAHLMPAFSRVGAYSLDEFEAIAFGAGSTPALREYWAHCAALIAPKDWGLFDFRRNEYRQRDRVKELLSPKHQLTNWIKGELKQNGPMTIAEFEHDSNKRTGNWWGWSEVKLILERLFFAGEMVSAGRRNFSRLYALPEQVEMPTLVLTEAEQKLELLKRSALALGVATEGELADYFRFTKTEAKASFKTLLQSGELVEVSVEGSQEPNYALTSNLKGAIELDYSRPLRLFNPFDPLTWHRDRTRRLFDFDYMIEIYTPEPKRKYGYYTLPILYKDRLVGRTDLKHDRKSGELRVLSLWKEDWVNKALEKEMAPHLEAEFDLARTFIGAEKLIPPSRGNWPL
jgi:uncharacterized protein YcaQ